ncbi:MAG: flagellar basal-body rod protein FlgG [Deltaproteobacteria bacterium]|nr:flagellar basal-body rod protein FlgG [Deltaproteobacteria bacterium]
MFRSLHVAATGMTAQETKLNTIANNLANANTTGFKRQEADFEDLLYQNLRAPTANAAGGAAPSGTQVGSGARVVSTSRAFAQGPIQQTGNPLDVAIEGNGFLAVNRREGEIAYTRAGALKVDAQGRLVTSDGLAVEPAITVPADATNIAISADGTVTATQAGQRQPSQLGQLQLVTFPNPNGLSGLGHNLYEASASSGEPQAGTAGADGRGTFLQGALEGSNVEVVTEMIALVRTQRAYEINSKVVSAADEMMRNATQVR